METSPQVAQARQAILAAARDILPTMPDGPGKQRILTLVAAAEAATTLSPMAIRQLTAYARVLHREPPTRRTLAGMLEWLSA